MMPRRLLMLALTLLTVGLALTVDSPARGAEITAGKYALFAADDTQDDSAGDNENAEVAADTEVYRSCADCEDASDAGFAPSTMLVTGDGLVDGGALDKLRQLVDELAAAGELSADGADKLRAALQKALAPAAVGTAGGQAAVAGTYRSIVVEREKDGQAKAAAKAYTIALSGDGEDGVCCITLDEGADGGPLAISISADGTVHSLTIETGEDGTLTVTGEGVSDEELAQIRQALKEAEAERVNVELEDGKVMMKTAGKSGNDAAVLLLKELPELKELKRLEELHQEGMISDSELEHEAQLLFLEDLPELKELGRLEELFKEGMISESELEHDAQLLFLKERPELKELGRLEELNQQGMLREHELQEQLEALKWFNVDTPDLPGGLDELKELQCFKPSDVDALLKLGDGGLTLDLRELAEATDSSLEAEIAAVLKQIEELLRDFAARYADK